MNEEPEELIEKYKNQPKPSIPYYLGIIPFILVIAAGLWYWL